MSLPLHQLSSVPVEGVFLDPDKERQFLLEDYEQGGFALEDTSEDMNFQKWTITYSGIDVIVTPENAGGTVLFSLSGISEVSLAFDQTMHPFVTYVRNGDAFYWWFNPLTVQQEHVQMDVGVMNPRACLDDKRIGQTSSSDILLAYVIGTELFYREQRDRFDVEYLLATGIIAPLKIVGMTDIGRVQFEFGSLQGGTFIPPGHCITGGRIYEIKEGFKTGDESKTELNSGMFAVGDFDFDGNTTWYDPSMQLDTYQNFEPPKSTKGLAVMRNGALVTFKGNRLYFSEPPTLGPAPHAWSGMHDIELDDEIVGIICDGNDLYVGTKGYPYVVTHEIPRVGGYTYQETKIAEWMPLASDRTMAVTGDGVLMMSTEGIGLLKGANGAIISEGHFSRRQWKLLKPETGVAVAVGGKYIFSTSEKAYIFFYGSRSHKHSPELSHLTELELLGSPNDMLVTKDGTILFDKPSDRCESTHNRVMEWDIADDEVVCLNCCKYQYQSKIYVDRQMNNPGAFKVSFDENQGPVIFAIKSHDGNNITLRHERKIIDIKPKRLPSGYSATDFSYDITGCAEVFEVHITNKVSDLALLPRDDG